MNAIENCQAYIKHLQSEHHRLHELLQDIAREFAEPHQTPEKERAALLARRLESLQAELVAHFREEEEGGCLEEAVVRCPSLAPDAKRTCAEHGDLREMLATLVEKLGAEVLPPWAELQRDYRTLAARLHAHEAAENRLMQMAYGAEGADFEVDQID